MTNNHSSSAPTAMPASPLLREGQGGGRYFTLKEFSHSDTAVSLGIDNTIPDKCVPHIETLVHYVLDPIRKHWGLPIRVTSGYRCPELNDEVCGVEDSYHMDGCAADISALDPERNVELMSLIRTLQILGVTPLTECYLAPKAKYIHIAYRAGCAELYPFI